MNELDDEERILLESLAEIQKTYQRQAQPIIERLVKIRSMRPVTIMVPAESPYASQIASAEGLNWARAVKP